MAIEWEAARVLVDASQFGLTVGVGLYAWWSSRSRAAKQEIAQLSTGLNAVDRRVDGIEKDIENAPGHRDIEVVRNTVNTLSGEVRALTGSVASMTNSVNLMIEHLMNGGNRG